MAGSTRRTLAEALAVSPLQHRTRQTRILLHASPERLRPLDLSGNRNVHRYTMLLGDDGISGNRDDLAVPGRLKLDFSDQLVGNHGQLPSGAQ